MGKTKRFQILWNAKTKVKLITNQGTTTAKQWEKRNEEGLYMKYFMTIG